MKAIIETNEPVIRPVAAQPQTRTARSPSRSQGFVLPIAPALFHAWRA